MAFNLGSIGSLFVSLSVDTAQFEGDMGKAAHIAQKQSLKIEQAVAAIGPTVAAAAVAAAGALALMIKNTIDTGDQLNKMSTRTGFTVERLSELQYAAKLADVEVGQLQSSLGFFNKAIADAHDPTSKQATLFRALGVDISQGAQPAFDQFMRGIEALPTHEAKIAAMRVAFGRSGDSLLAMAGNMQEATAQARKLGVVMSADMARQSEQFKDNMTALGASSGAFAMAATNEVLPALTRVSGRLVEAAEKGEKLKGILAELARAMANFTILRAVPGLPDVVESMLKNPPATGGSTGGWDGGAPDVNAAMAACAVSGGKWVNGKCRHGGKGKAVKDDNLVGKQLAEDQEEWNKTMAEAAAATDKYNKTMREREHIENMGWEGVNSEEDLKNRLQGIDALIESEEIRMRLAAGFDAQGNRIQENLKAQNSLARDLGLTFTSAFEDAIVGGKKFRDVLAGIAMDIAKIAVRKTITEPAGAAISKLFSGLAFGMLGGGDTVFEHANGGRFSAGDTMLVGERGPELVRFDTAGEVIPNHELGGGGVTIQQHINFSANTPAAVRDAVFALAPTLTQAAIAGVRDSQRRGR